MSESGVPRLELGIVGLGHIGGNLALHALEGRIRVVGSSRRPPRRELLQAGLIDAGPVARLPDSLASRPRRILLYVPAGATVDQVLDALIPNLEPGDIVADGGNSYWKDSRARWRRLRARGLHFLDAGTSGGIEGARQGACFMVGGEKAPVAAFEPILRSLAADGGYVHAGPPGAGHFTKLVHNGIEFGMLQAIGEGVGLLKRYGDELDLRGILEAWRHGSVIRSWLIELLARQYSERGGMEEVSPYVEDTGEVNWLVSDALRMEVPIPVISQAVMQLFASRDGDRYWARAIAMMRNGFGSHPLGPDEEIRTLRHTARLSDAQELANEDGEPARH